MTLKKQRDACNGGMPFNRGMELAHPTRGKQSLSVALTIHWGYQTVEGTCPGVFRGLGCQLNNIVQLICSTFL